MHIRIPQGTVLGSLLFITYSYINSLLKTRIDGYADDTLDDTLLIFNDKWNLVKEKAELCKYIKSNTGYTIITYHWMMQRISICCFKKKITN